MRDISALICFAFMELTAEVEMGGLLPPAKSHDNGLQQFVFQSSVHKTTNRTVFISDFTFQLHHEGGRIGDFIDILTIALEDNVSTVVGHSDTVVNDSRRTSEVKGTHGKKQRM